MATQVFKVALPGYNAYTDTDPNHFSLYVDQLQDFVLIKQKTTGTVSVNNSANQSISHGLGYIPFCIVFMDNGDGSYQRIYGVDVGAGDTGFTVSTTNLTISNYSGGTKTFKYYIFYDDITE